MITEMVNITTAVEQELFPAMNGVRAAAQNALTSFTWAGVLVSLASTVYIIGFVEQKLVWMKSTAVLAAANPKFWAAAVVLLLAHAYYTAQPLADVQRVKLELRKRIKAWKADLKDWLKTPTPSWQTEASLMARLTRITKDVSDKAKEVAFQQTIFHENNGITMTLCMIGCSVSGACNWMVSNWCQFNPNYADMFVDEHGISELNATWTAAVNKSNSSMTKLTDQGINQTAPATPAFAFAAGTIMHAKDSLQCALKENADVAHETRHAVQSYTGNYGIVALILLLLVTIVVLMIMFNWAWNRFKDWQKAMKYVGFALLALFMSVAVWRFMSGIMQIIVDLYQLFMDNREVVMAVVVPLCALGLSMWYVEKRKPTNVESTGVMSASRDTGLWRPLRSTHVTMQELQPLIEDALGFLQDERNIAVRPEMREICDDSDKLGQFYTIEWNRSKGQWDLKGKFNETFYGTGGPHRV